MGARTAGYDRSAVITGVGLGVLAQLGTGDATGEAAGVCQRYLPLRYWSRTLPVMFPNFDVLTVSLLFEGFCVTLAYR